MPFKLNFDFDGVTDEILELVEMSKTTVAGLVRDALEKETIATRAATRDVLYARILREYMKLNYNINGLGKRKVRPIARAATNQAGKDSHQGKRAIVQFSERRMNEVLEAANPAGAHDLAAVYTENMAKSEVGALRTALINVMRESAVSDATAFELREKLQKEWSKLSRNKSEKKFTDRAGRKWDDEVYTEMLVRTTAWNVWREAYLNRGSELGIDLYRISDDGGSPNKCEVCARWEGRIVSLSGLDSRFPSDADARAAGVFHPNCVHRYEMMVAGWDDAEIEEQARRVA